MKRFQWALAALAGLGLLAGCTSGSGATTTPVPESTGATSTAPAGGTSPATTAPSSGGAASAELSAAIAALKAGPTLHLDASTTTTQGTITYSDDATASGGRQDITSSTGIQIKILYVGGVGYVLGNAVGLADFMGVSPAEAQREAGRWIAVRPGEELGQNTYDDIVDGITLSSVATEITVAGPLTETGPTTVSGQQVIVVTGGAPASDQLPSSARVTLDVTATGSRPLLETTTAGSDYRSTISFSDWGESVSLTAPANAVAPPSSGSGPVVT